VRKRGVGRRRRRRKGTYAHIVAVREGHFAAVRHGGCGRKRGGIEIRYWAETRGDGRAGVGGCEGGRSWRNRSMMVWRKRCRGRATVHVGERDVT
jgi:hypothetical protein